MSGIFQAGYPRGYRSPRLFRPLLQYGSWRGMFLIGALPVVCCLYLI